MTETKARILETARGMFNDQGLHRVGVRDIARALDMSPGNLAYHYATKDQLIAALVLELVALNERTVFSGMPERFGLKTLHAMAKGALENMLGYRFILLSPLEAWTAAPDLTKLSASLAKKRRKRHDAMLRALIASGAVQRETEARSETLFEQSEMISSHWLTVATIRGWSDARAVRHFAKLGCALLEPHCTPLGMREMKEVLDE